MFEEQLEFQLLLEPRIFPSRLDTSFKYPEYSIKLNDKEIHNGYLKEIQTFKFKEKFNEGYHVLSISFLNKDNDTVADEHGNIIEDLCVQIKQLFINDIEISYDILNQACVYNLHKEVDYKNEKITKIDGFHQYLSWNGTWQLKFKSPFYVWLLDQL